MLEIALKSQSLKCYRSFKTKIPYIKLKTLKKINVKKAYVVNITSHENKVTIIASGTEVELALKVQDKLKENNIHSKVVSMPCMELFDQQPEDYRDVLKVH